MVKRKKTSLISVQGTPVTIIDLDQNDYISLTDMAKARTDSARAADVIKNWLRARSTLEFLGTWESLYNPDFKVVEFACGSGFATRDDSHIEVEIDIDSMI